jgi:hypothetical protein
MKTFSINEQFQFVKIKKKKCKNMYFWMLELRMIGDEKLFSFKRQQFSQQWCVHKFFSLSFAFLHINALPPFHRMLNSSKYHFYAVCERGLFFYFMLFIGYEENI